MTSPSDPMPRSFARRTTAVVILAFLATMAVFLWLAFRSERRLHHRATFEHLEETLAILSMVPELGGQPTEVELGKLEERLTEATGVPHRILLTDSLFSIVASTSAELLGGDIRSHFHLVPEDPSETGRAFGSTEAEPWIVASRTHGNAGRLYLLRSGAGGDEIADQFWRIHGLHVGVTLLVFAIVLSFLGDAFVQRPIEDLAAHIRRIEAGQFDTRPEIHRNDEFGWLAERFTEMSVRLKEAVEKLVRSEKAAAAGAVAYRVARQAVEPLGRLKRHVADLERIAGKDAELVRVVAALEKDRWRLADAVLLLEQLAPKSAESGNEPDADGTGETEVMEV